MNEKRELTEEQREELLKPVEKPGAHFDVYLATGELPAQLWDRNLPAEAWRNVFGAATYMGRLAQRLTGHLTGDEATVEKSYEIPNPFTAEGEELPGFFTPVDRPVTGTVSFAATAAWNLPSTIISGVGEIASIVNPYTVVREIGAHIGRHALARRSALALGEGLYSEAAQERYEYTLNIINQHSRPLSELSEIQQVIALGTKEFATEFVPDLFVNMHSWEGYERRQTIQQRMPVLHGLGQKIEQRLPIVPWTGEQQWASAGQRVGRDIQTRPGEFLVDVTLGAAFGGGIASSALRTSKFLRRATIGARNVTNDLRMGGIFEFDDVNLATGQRLFDDRAATFALDYVQHQTTGFVRRSGDIGAALRLPTRYGRQETLTYNWGGAGALIEQDGETYLATAAHFILGHGADAKDPFAVPESFGYRARSLSGDHSLTILDQRAKISPETDIALLRVRGAEGITPFRVADDISEVHTLLGRAGETAPHRMIDTRGNAIYMSTASGIAGESGAPVVGEQGEVSGVYVGAWTLGEGDAARQIGGYAGAESLRSLIEGPGEWQRPTEALARQLDQQLVYKRFSRGELGVRITDRRTDPRPQTSLILPETEPRPQTGGLVFPGDAGFTQMSREDKPFDADEYWERVSRRGSRYRKVDKTSQQQESLVEQDRRDRRKPRGPEQLSLFDELEQHSTMWDDISDLEIGLTLRLGDRRSSVFTVLFDEIYPEEWELESRVDPSRVMGTAFLTDQGDFLTSSHVLFHDDPVEATLLRGWTPEALDTGYRYIRRQHGMVGFNDFLSMLPTDRVPVARARGVIGLDVSQLDVPDLSGERSRLSLIDEPASVGGKMASIGNALYEGLPQTIKPLQRVMERHDFLSDVFVEPGFSGSPILRDYDVTGIMRAMFRDLFGKPDYNIAVGVEAHAVRSALQDPDAMLDWRGFDAHSRGDQPFDEADYWEQVRQRGNQWRRIDYPTRHISEILGNFPEQRPDNLRDVMLWDDREDFIANRFALNQHSRRMHRVTSPFHTDYVDPTQHYTGSRGQLLGGLVPWADDIKQTFLQIKSPKISQTYREELAGHLSAVIQAERIPEAIRQGNWDYILPVPSSTDRIAKRGFSLSELVGRSFSRELELPMETSVLARIRQTIESSTLTFASERAANLEGAFGILDPEMVRGKNILVTDDIGTTWSTMEEIHKTLLEAGAESVGGLVVAKSWPGLSMQAPKTRILDRETALTSRTSQTLTPEQEAIVRHREGRAVVQAIPGAGKTFALEARAHAMRDEGIDPDNILSLSFTKAAAAELGERLGDEFPTRTIHSLAHELIMQQEHWELLGFDHRPKLLPDLSKKRFRALTRARPDMQGYALDMRQSYALQLARDAQTPDEWDAAYTLYKGERGIVTFDDYITQATRLLTEHPNILRQYQERYPFVQVDEFQDLSDTQFEFAKILGGDNLLAVGDPDQLIYGFRGVTGEGFQELAAESTLYNLSQNFRNRPEIFDIAQQFIAQNEAILSRQGSAIRPAGGRVTLTETDPSNIWESIAGIIDRSDPSDIALLFRTNYEIDRAFENLGERLDQVPYVGTYHKAKGLEYPHVILPMDTIPISFGGAEKLYEPKFKQPGSLEAERRVRYVGMTRAEDQLDILGRGRFFEELQGLVQHSRAGSSEFTSDYVWRFLTDDDRQAFGGSRRAFGELDTRDAVSFLQSRYPQAETLEKAIMRADWVNDVYFRAHESGGDLFTYRSKDLDLTMMYRGVASRNNLGRDFDPSTLPQFPKDVQLSFNETGPYITRGGAYAGWFFEQIRGYLGGLDIPMYGVTEGGQDLIIFRGQEFDPEPHWLEDELIVKPLEEIYRLDSYYLQDFETAPAELFAVSPRRRYLTEPRLLEQHSQGWHQDRPLRPGDREGFDIPGLQAFLSAVDDHDSVFYRFEAADPTGYISQDLAQQFALSDTDLSGILPDSILVPGRGKYGSLLRREGERVWRSHRDFGYRDPQPRVAEWGYIGRLGSYGFPKHQPAVGLRHSEEYGFMRRAENPIVLDYAEKQLSVHFGTPTPYRKYIGELDADEEVFLSHDVLARFPVHLDSSGRMAWEQYHVSPYRGEYIETAGVDLQHIADVVRQLPETRGDANRVWGDYLSAQSGSPDYLAALSRGIRQHSAEPILAEHGTTPEGRRGIVAAGAIQSPRLRGASLDEAQGMKFIDVVAGDDDLNFFSIGSYKRGVGTYGVRYELETALGMPGARYRPHDFISKYRGQLAKFFLEDPALDDLFAVPRDLFAYMDRPFRGDPAPKLQTGWEDNWETLLTPAEQDNLATIFQRDYADPFRAQTELRGATALYQIYRETAGGLGHSGEIVIPGSVPISKARDFWIPTEGTSAADFPYHHIVDIETFRNIDQHSYDYGFVEADPDKPSLAELNRFVNQHDNLFFRATHYQEDTLENTSLDWAQTLAVSMRLREEGIDVPLRGEESALFPRSLYEEHKRTIDYQLAPASFVAESPWEPGMMGVYQQGVYGVKDLELLLKHAYWNPNPRLHMGGPELRLLQGEVIKEGFQVSLPPDAQGYAPPGEFIIKPERMLGLFDFEDIYGLRSGDAFTGQPMELVHNLPNYGVHGLRPVEEMDQLMSRMQQHSFPPAAIDWEADRLKYFGGGRDLNEGYNFGIEIEFLGSMSRVDFARELERFDNAPELVYDASLEPIDPSAMVAIYQRKTGSFARGSRPRLDETRKLMYAHELVWPVMSGEADLQSIKSVVDYAESAMDIEMNTRAAFHIHVGHENLTADQIINIHGAFANYESIIDLMHPPHRRDRLMPLVDRLSGDYDDPVEGLAYLESHYESLRGMPKEEVLQGIPGNVRYRKLNTLGAGLRTLEYRSPSTSLDFEELHGHVRFIIDFIDKYKDFEFFPRGWMHSGRPEDIRRAGSELKVGTSESEFIDSSTLRDLFREERDARRLAQHSIPKPLDEQTRRHRFFDAPTPITDDFTFGLEIEFLGGMSRVELTRELQQFQNAPDIIYDVSIKPIDSQRTSVSYQYDSGDYAYNSDPEPGKRQLYAHELVWPIMRGEEDLQSIKPIVEFIESSMDYELNTSMGMHIHVGASDLEIPQIVNIVGAFHNYERAIDKLHYPSRRKAETRYAHPIVEPGERELVDRFQAALATTDRSTALYEISEGIRYRKINVLGAGQQTLEYRQPATTLDFKQVEGHIRFITNFVEHFQDFEYFPREWMAQGEWTQEAARRARSEIGVGERQSNRIPYDELRELFRIEREAYQQSPNRLIVSSTPAPTPPAPPPDPASPLLHIPDDYEGNLAMIYGDLAREAVDPHIAADIVLQGMHLQGMHSSIFWHEAHRVMQDYGLTPTPRDWSQRGMARHHLYGRLRGQDIETQDFNTMVETLVQSPVPFERTHLSIDTDMPPPGLVIRDHVASVVNDPSAVDIEAITLAVMDLSSYQGAIPDIQTRIAQEIAGATSSSSASVRSGATSSSPQSVGGTGLFADAFRDVTSEFENIFGRSPTEHWEQSLVQSYAANRTQTPGVHFDSEEYLRRVHGLEQSMPGVSRHDFGNINIVALMEETLRVYDDLVGSPPTDQFYLDDLFEQALATNSSMRAFDDALRQQLLQSNPPAPPDIDPAIVATVDTLYSSTFGGMIIEEPLSNVHQSVMHAATQGSGSIDIRATFEEIRDVWQQLPHGTRLDMSNLENVRGLRQFYSEFEGALGFAPREQDRMYIDAAVEGAVASTRPRDEVVTDYINQYVGTMQTRRSLVTDRTWGMVDRVFGLRPEAYRSQIEDIIEQAFHSAGVWSEEALSAVEALHQSPPGPHTIWTNPTLDQHSRSRDDISVQRFTGRLRKDMWQYKEDFIDPQYASRRPVYAQRFAEFLHSHLPEGIDISEYDALLAVPTSAASLERRGFSPLGGIAEHFARITGLPLLEGVIEDVGTQSVKKMSRAEREAYDKFSVTDPSQIEGQRILLLDDVMTTGTTMRQAAEHLEQAGASSVDMLTLGATLPLDEGKRLIQGLQRGEGLSWRDARERVMSAPGPYEEFRSSWRRPVTQLALTTQKYPPTPSQQRSIEHTYGDAVTIAGPGSGKSRSLLSRLQYLGEHDIARPDELLTVVFGKKAEQELITRAAAEGQSAWSFRTIDAFAYDIVREHHERLGYTRSPRIDNTPFEDWLKRNARRMREFGVDTAELSPDRQKSWVEMYKEIRKEHASGPEDYSSLPEPLQRGIHAYRKERWQRNVLSHQDAMLQAGYLLESHPDIRASYRERFKFLQVDEFQDVSPQQWRLLRNVSPNIWAVGDLDQSIMSFRGGAGEVMQELLHQGAAFYNIEENFRSRPEITRAAHGFIASQRGRMDISQTAVREQGGEVEIIPLAQTATQQAGIEAVVGAIEHGQETAILTRTHRERKKLLSKVGWELQQSGWSRSDIESMLHFETLHGSKGKEYEHVILPVNLLDSDFGSKGRDVTLPTRHAKTAQDYAEEERLFYVGMTRAEDRLTIIGDPQHQYIERVGIALGERRADPVKSYLEQVPSPGEAVTQIIDAVEGAAKESRSNFFRRFFGKFRQDSRDLPFGAVDLDSPDLVGAAIPYLQDFLKAVDEHPNVFYRFAFGNEPADFHSQDFWQTSEFGKTEDRWGNRIVIPQPDSYLALPQDFPEGSFARDRAGIWGTVTGGEGSIYRRGKYVLPTSDYLAGSDDPLTAFRHSNVPLDPDPYGRELHILFGTPTPYRDYLAPTEDLVLPHGTLTALPTNLESAVAYSVELDKYVETRGADFPTLIAQIAQLPENLDASAVWDPHIRGESSPLREQLERDFGRIVQHSSEQVTVNRQKFIERVDAWHDLWWRMSDPAEDTMTYRSRDDWQTQAALQALDWNREFQMTADVTWEPDTEKGAYFKEEYWDIVRPGIYKDEALFRQGIFVTPEFSGLRDYFYESPDLIAADAYKNRDVRVIQGVPTTEREFIFDVMRNEDVVSPQAVRFSMPGSSFRDDTVSIDRQFARELGLVQHSREERTFGIEVEGYFGTEFNWGEYPNFPDFEVAHEGTLWSRGKGYPREIKSPILRGASGIDTFRSFFADLLSHGARFDDTAGLHVHVGIGDLRDEQVINVAGGVVRMEEAVDTLFAPMGRTKDAVGKPIFASPEVKATLPYEYNITFPGEYISRSRPSYELEPVPGYPMYAPFEPVSEALSYLQGWTRGEVQGADSIIAPDGRSHHRVATDPVMAMSVSLLEHTFGKKDAADFMAQLPTHTARYRTMDFARALDPTNWTPEERLQWEEGWYQRVQDAAGGDFYDLAKTINPLGKFTRYNFNTGYDTIEFRQMYSTGNVEDIVDHVYRAVNFVEEWKDRPFVPGEHSTDVDTLLQRHWPADTSGIRFRQDSRQELPQGLAAHLTSEENFKRIADTGFLIPPVDTGRRVGMEDIDYHAGDEIYNFLGMFRNREGFDTSSGWGYGSEGLIFPADVLFDKYNALVSDVDLYQGYHHLMGEANEVWHEDIGRPQGRYLTDPDKYFEDADYAEIFRALAGSLQDDLRYSGEEAKLLFDRDPETIREREEWVFPYLTYDVTVQDPEVLVPGRLPVSEAVGVIRRQKPYYIQPETRHLPMREWVIEPLKMDQHSRNPSMRAAVGFVGYRAVVPVIEASGKEEREGGYDMGAFQFDVHRSPHPNFNPWLDPTPEHPLMPEDNPKQQKRDPVWVSPHTRGTIGNQYPVRGHYRNRGSFTFSEGASYIIADEIDQTPARIFEGLVTGHRTNEEIEERLTELERKQDDIRREIEQDKTLTQSQRIAMLQDLDARAASQADALREYQTSVGQVFQEAGGSLVEGTTNRIVDWGVDKAVGWGLSKVGLEALNFQSLKPLTKAVAPYVGPAAMFAMLAYGTVTSIMEEFEDRETPEEARARIHEERKESNRQFFSEIRGHTQGTPDAPEAVSSDDFQIEDYLTDKAIVYINRRLRLLTERGITSNETTNENRTN